jgi:hypothetical protein
MMSKRMFAYEVIRNTNFAKDYDSIEQQLMPIVDNKVSDDDLVDAIKALFEDLQAKRHMTKERLEFFIYDVNDINYLLYDGKNKKLKDLEIHLGTIVDNMK